MKPFIAALAVFCLTGALPAGAQSDLKIPIEKYKLSNGLRVILSRDTAVPVISTYVIYNVGARSEEKGRTGFAHLFEHMMFQGSANIKKGEHFKYVQDNGGSMNGSTHPDYTDYFETLPSNKLALSLWLESDRMKSLAITDENLTNQKEAVKQERRLRFDSQPYTNALVEKWADMSYSNFQSAHSLIGSFDDLNAATTADVAKFFKTYYAPNNAVLVIAGDFETAEAKKLIETYFGTIPAQPQPARPDMTEPVRTAGKTDTYKDPRARVPAVIIGWPSPKRHTPEWYALNLLDAVLTGGESSRFQIDLVKGKQSILQSQTGVGFPFQDLSSYKDPGMFAGLFLYKPNFQGQQIVDQVQAEIDRVIAEGIDAKELERVKSVLRLAKVSAAQNSLARAQLIGQYEILDGKPEMADQDYTSLFAVTSAQIQDAAKKYLTPALRNVLFIQPAPPPTAPAPTPQAPKGNE